MAEKKKVRVLSSKTVFRGKVFEVTSDDIVEPNGIKGRRDVVRHQGSVVVLAVDDTADEARVLLARQYRYPVGDSMWELPAGRIDEGEQPLAAAKRELTEETGFSARKWKRGLTFYSSPGFLDEKMYLFAALGLKSGKANPDEDEVIGKRWFPLSAALRMAKTGKIRDAKTIVGLFWLTANGMSK